MDWESDPLEEFLMLFEGTQLPSSDLVARRDVPMMELLRTVTPELVRLYNEFVVKSDPETLSEKNLELRNRLQAMFEPIWDREAREPYVQEWEETRRPAKLGVNAPRS